ncbi:MAG TPA: TrbG/VirB9 family P-type conjugative transfer protein, partial [Solirubrobacterales bacterium]|nr:TrbG/VirB9 family P-type conjugative transfer protein [Solirubrobacterales bacterium]
MLLTATVQISTDSGDRGHCKGADGGEDGFNPRLGPIELIRFWYPDDLVKRWAAADRETEEHTLSDAASRLPLAAGLDALHFEYEVHADRHYPWTPSQVFDDGHNPYVRLPAPLGNQEMPVLFAVAADGKSELLNYAVAAGGRVLVADRVLEKAQLVLGSGAHQLRLTLTRKKAEGR